MKKLFQSRIVILALVPLVFLLAGCAASTPGSSTAAADGGIWQSIDGGQRWNQISDVAATKGKIVKISNVDVTNIVFDPTDSSIIYLTTENNGIIYSYDGGSSWQKFKTLNKGKIRGLAVDPKNHCTIFALQDNKLYKSTDCGHQWMTPYYHQKPEVYLSGLAIDPVNTNILYMGNSAGELMKSADGGNSWNTVFRAQYGANKLGGVIADIIVDPKVTSIIYVGTLKTGLYKSVDGGDNWNSLGEGLKSYVGSHEYKKLILDPATDDSLIFISKFGILRTTDGGTTWKIIPILPNSKAVSIQAVAVNPQNSDVIYYTTETTFLKTADSGSNWSSQKLPFSRWGSAIAVNPDKTSIIYLGSFKPTKK